MIMSSILFQMPEDQPISGTITGIYLLYAGLLYSAGIQI